VVIEAKMIDALLSIVRTIVANSSRRPPASGCIAIAPHDRAPPRGNSRRLQRLDDLIAEVQSQVRSLSRQRKRAERYTEIMARRFTVEICLAQRETQAWSEELVALEARVVALRESAPILEQAMVTAERARDEAHANRAGTEAQRAELSRL